MSSPGERAPLRERHPQRARRIYLMNSPEPTPQIQALEASIEKLLAKPVQPGDGTAATLASQMMQKDNLQKDLFQQVKQNQDQMIRDQMEQARLRSELAYKEQAKLAQARQEQTLRDTQSQAKLRQEQILRYEQQQAKLKQEQSQRDQQDQARRRQEQMQREQQLQARLKQEQLQREQQLQARMKQEQAQREKARQEQMQKDRAQQEKLRQEQHQKELLLAARLKEERERVNQLKQEQLKREQQSNADKNITGGDKKAAKNAPKTPEQLAKDEEARAFSARSELSLTSIAFCSPLMLFGMGAAMSIFDNFSGNKKNPALLEARKKNQQQMELSEYARKQADKKFNEMVERNNLTNLPNVSDSTKKLAEPTGDDSSEKSALKAKEKAEKERVNRFVEAEAANAQAISRRNDSLEVKKLWKERQRLLENLERVRGQGSLALVSKLVSQLETLDRSLKRLGCDPQA